VDGPTVSEGRHSAFLDMLAALHERHLVGVPDRTELWLIRHADAYAGLEQLEDGLLNPPLSSEGEAQAALLTARLAAVHFDEVWASDLRRAIATAHAVAVGRGLEVQIDQRLREVRTYWDEGRVDSLGDPREYPFPEPMEEVAARMRAVLDSIVQRLERYRSQPRRALVASHNAAISILLHRLLGLEWAQLRVMPQFTSLSVIAVKDGRYVVQSIADATHLSGMSLD